MTVIFGIIFVSSYVIKSVMLILKVCYSEFIKFLYCFPAFFCSPKISSFGSFLDYKMLQMIELMDLKKHLILLL